eukprot:TRINITY_DN34695_c0_g1_i1.p2 TRINITY_DN34695_c0_g1~~TRINITY_DN34695_c0_g1_i1.p2  ORF type:complete len:196 (+),score=32.03 TRINITY_DN34695_c0_g1_i1:62-649(+)
MPPVTESDSDSDRTQLLYTPKTPRTKSSPLRTPRTTTSSQQRRKQYIPRTTTSSEQKRRKRKLPLCSRAGAAGGRGGKNGQRRKRRARRGTVAAREIRVLQRSTRLVLRPAGFKRLVQARGLIARFGAAEADRLVRTGEPAPLKFTKKALHALQVAAEEYMVRLFQDAMLAQLHRKALTLGNNDLKFVRRLRGEY